VKRAWRSAALVALNTLVLFAVLNLVAWFVLGILERRRNANLGPMVDLFGFEKVSRAYPEWNERDLRQLLAENHRIVSENWTYDPATVFRLQPFQGRYVNVAADGYRLSEPGPRWPPERGTFNVFLFGGSTAFGYGVADNETIAFHLKQKLSAGGRAVQVYNLGCLGFFSSQERARFEQLLLGGIRPDVAIFLDGLNDLSFPDEPILADRVRYLMDQINRPSTPSRFVFLLRALPLAQAARLTMREESGVSTLDCPALQARWSANRRMIEAIAGQFGVRTLFVWQPIASYQYPRQSHIFSEPPHPQMNEIARCYASMESRRGELGTTNFLWLAGVQSNRRENLYVDRVHYTAAFNGEIAEAISRHIGLQEASMSRPIPRSSSTALRRSLSTALRSASRKDSLMASAISPSDF
jgi:hypothetical protein